MQVESMSRGDQSHCRCWNPPEEVFLSEENNRRAVDFLLSCVICSDHVVQCMVLPERKERFSCIQERNRYFEAWRGRKWFLIGNSHVHSRAMGLFKDISQHCLVLFPEMCEECALDLPQPDYLIHPRLHTEEHPQA